MIAAKMVFIRFWGPGNIARLADDVPANQILQTCCKAQDGVRPSPDWRRARG